MSAMKKTEFGRLLSMLMAIVLTLMAVWIAGGAGLTSGW
jgi:hypothetical protein